MLVMDPSMGEKSKRDDWETRESFEKDCRNKLLLLLLLSPPTFHVVSTKKVELLEASSTMIPNAIKNGTIKHTSFKPDVDDEQHFETLFLRSSIFQFVKSASLWIPGFWSTFIITIIYGEVWVLLVKVSRKELRSIKWSVRRGKNWITYGGVKTSTYLSS